MLIRPAIGDTDPIRYRRPTPDGQFSGNIIDEAMRPFAARNINSLARRSASGPHADQQTGFKKLPEGRLLQVTPILMPWRSDERASESRQRVMLLPALRVASISRFQ